MEPEIKLQTHEFSVTNSDSVSLRKLCMQMHATLSETTPLNPCVPVAILVTYGLNAIAWRPAKFRTPSWHLRLPNASACLSAANAVIVDSGFCAEQQIVTASVLKYPTQDTINVLKLEIHELAPPCQEDKPTLEFKVLKYYLERCAEKTRRPNYTEFNNMLKKLRRVNQSAKEKDSKLLSDVLKNYGNSNLITE